MKRWSVGRGSAAAGGWDLHGLPLAFLVPVLWAAAALAFGVSDSGDPWRHALAAASFCSAAAFALAASGWAAWRSRGTARIFWSLVSAGFLCGLAGFLVWLGFGGARLAPLGLMPRDPIYTLYYLLLFAAFLYLVAATTKGIAPLSPLDTLAVMASTGVLAWHFVLRPAVAGAPAGSLGEILANFSGSVADAGLLFLALVVLSGERRPPFAGRLAEALVVFLAADLVYVAEHPLGTAEPGGWPVMLWGLGMALFGLAALRGVSGESRLPAGEAGISLWRTFSFWLGPLSPAVQYGFLAGWSALHPPVPAYVTWTGVCLMIYFAFRTSTLAYLSRRLRCEAEGLARREEQVRISEDLHGSLKRSVGGVYWMLRAYREACGRGDEESAARLLSQAEASARRAGYQVSHPIEELQSRCGEGLDPGCLLLQLAADVQECFGVRVHTDLRASLDGLGEKESAAVYRVVSEALWNAARHSAAANIWLKTRLVGPVLVVRVRDDGRGFSKERAQEGFGMKLMRRRAEEMGPGWTSPPVPTAGPQCSCGWRWDEAPEASGRVLT